MKQLHYGIPYIFSLQELKSGFCIKILEHIIQCLSPLQTFSCIILVYFPVLLIYTIIIKLYSILIVISPSIKEIVHTFRLIDGNSFHLESTIRHHLLLLNPVRYKILSEVLVELREQSLITLK